MREIHWPNLRRQEGSTACITVDVIVAICLASFGVLRPPDRKVSQFVKEMSRTSENIFVDNYVM